MDELLAKFNNQSKPTILSLQVRNRISSPSTPSSRSSNSSSPSTPSTPSTPFSPSSFSSPRTLSELKSLTNQIKTSSNIPKKSSILLPTTGIQSRTTQPVQINTSTSTPNVSISNRPLTQLPLTQLPLTHVPLTQLSKLSQQKPNDLPITQQNLNYLENLPFEILIEVLKNLEYDVILKYCQISNLTKNLCNDEDFWSMLAFEKYGITKDEFNQKDVGMSNRERFLEIMSQDYNNLKYGSEKYIRLSPLKIKPDEIENFERVGRAKPEVFDYLNRQSYKMYINFYKFAKSLVLNADDNLIKHFIQENVMKHIIIPKETPEQDQDFFYLWYITIDVLIEYLILTNRLELAEYLYTEYRDKKFSDILKYSYLDTHIFGDKVFLTYIKYGRIDMLKTTNLEISRLFGIDIFLYAIFYRRYDLLVILKDYYHITRHKIFDFKHPRTTNTFHYQIEYLLSYLTHKNTDENIAIFKWLKHFNYFDDTFFYYGNNRILKFAYINEKINALQWFRDNYNFNLIDFQEAMDINTLKTYPKSLKWLQDGYYVTL
jgi:hypothetical protein